MSCVYEHLDICVSKSINELAQMFNDYFKNDFYWRQDEIKIAPNNIKLDSRYFELKEQYGHIDVKKNKDGSGTISFEAPPFFVSSEMENQVMYFFDLFCATHIDIEADLFYYAENDNGSSICLDYQYRNNHIDGYTVHGKGYSYELHCDNCGYSQTGNPLFDITTFSENEKYICPNCGAEVNTDDWYVEEHSFGIQDFIDGAINFEPLLQNMN